MKSASCNVSSEFFISMNEERKKCNVLPGSLNELHFLPSPILSFTLKYQLRLWHKYIFKNYYMLNVSAILNKKSCYHV